MESIRILALASGQALPSSGHPFCHQEEGNWHSYLPKVDDGMIRVWGM